MPLFFSTIRFPNPHLYAWAGFFCFAILISCVKALGPDVPVSLTIMARSWVGLLCLLPLVHRAGWQATLITRYPRRQFVRAGCGVFALGLNFYALSRLPLADAQGLSQLYPVFLVVLAPLLLDEYAGWRQWLALGIGLSGALLIARSQDSGAGDLITLIPAVCVMGSAIASAGGDLLARYMGRHDTPLTITVWLFGLLGLFSLIWWLGEWVLGLHNGLTLTWHQSALLIAIGASGAAAQLCIVQGFKFLPAATMGTYASLGLVWAVLFGVLFFGEQPSLWFAVGAALILLAARLAARTPPARAPSAGPVASLATPVAGLPEA